MEISGALVVGNIIILLINIYALIRITERRGQIQQGIINLEGRINTRLNEQSALLERTNAVKRVQFEKEFDTYQTVASSIVNLINHYTKCLDDNYNVNELNDAYQAALDDFTKNEPFYTREIFKFGLTIFHKLPKNATKEELEENVLVGEKEGVEVRQLRSVVCRDELIKDYRELSDQIRERLSFLADG